MHHVGHVMPVIDLLGYLTDSSVIHSVITQHFDKFLECLAQIKPQFAPVRRIKQLLKLMLSVCPDTAAHVREILTQPGKYKLPPVL